MEQSAGLDQKPDGSDDLPESGKKPTVTKLPKKKKKRLFKKQIKKRLQSQLFLEKEAIERAGKPTVQRSDPKD